MTTQFEQAAAALKTSLSTATARGQALLAFGQSNFERNFEATAKAAEIWTAGFQELSASLSRAARSQYDENVATLKALSSVRSLKSALDLQTAFVRGSFEKAAAESAKFATDSKKLAAETVAPLAARMTAAIELPRHVA